MTLIVSLYLCVLVLTVAFGESLNVMEKISITSISECAFVQSDQNCLNVLQCARSCKQNTACEYMMFKNNAYKVSRDESNNCGNWKKYLSLNETSGELTGDVDHFIQAVNSGYDVAEVHTGGSGKWLKYNRVMTIYVYNKTICTLIEPYPVYSSGRQKGLIFCSDGNHRQVAVEKFEPFDVNESDFTAYDMLDWYVKESVCMSNAEAYNDLMIDDAFKNGLPVIAINTNTLDLRVVRKTPNSIRFETRYELSTKANELSVEYDASDGRVSQFNEPAVWMQTTYTSHGVANTVACKEIAGATCEVNSKNENLKWLVDINWYKIFANNVEGEESYGNICTLVKKIKAGNRVRVLFQNTLFEPYRLFVLGEHVYAMLDEEVNITTVGSDNTLTRVKLISTSGQVETLNINYDDGSVTITTTQSSAQWFVEKSKWKVVYDSLDMVDAVNLIDAVANCNQFRLLLQSQDIFSDSDDHSYTFITTLGSFLINKNNGPIIGRLAPFPDIHTNSKDVQFRKKPVVSWILLKVSISLAGEGKIIYSNRTHGENNYGDQMESNGQITLLHQP